MEEQNIFHLNVKIITQITMETSHAKIGRHMVSEETSNIQPEQKSNRPCMA
jgi:hypothetical protein